MTFIETKHTFGIINKIKTDLEKLTILINYISMVFFVGYYIFLIIKNLNNVFYLTIYSLLFLTALSSFIIEMMYKKRKDDSRKLAKEKQEKRERAYRLVKIIKYLLKFITISISVYTMLQNEVLKISFVLDIVVIFTFIISIIMEFVIYFLKKYIDYLKFAFELDFDQSLVSKLSKVQRAKNLSQIVNKINGISIYTAQEEAMIEVVIEEGKKYKESQDKRIQELNNQSIKNLLNAIKTKMPTKIKDIIIENYNKVILEAKKIQESFPKIRVLIQKAEELISKYITDEEIKKLMGMLINYIKEYLEHKLPKVDINIIGSIIGVILYFVNSFNKNKSIDKDEILFVISKCLDNSGNLLNQFIK